MQISDSMVYRIFTQITKICELGSHLKSARWPRFGQNLSHTSRLPFLGSVINRLCRFSERRYCQAVYLKFTAFPLCTSAFSNAVRN